MMEYGPNQRGFTFLELVVAMAIIAILVVTLTPSILTTMRNSQIRAVASAWRDGLAQARIEAIRLNTEVTFQPTADFSGWNLTQAGATGTPLATYQNSTNETTNIVTSLKANTSVTYDGTGRMVPLNGQFISVFSPAKGTCLAAGGNIRCLTVEATAGYVRTCDPSAASSSPLACTVKVTT
jgi:type IV fimbrial biogenesis protein FimT